MMTQQILDAIVQIAAPRIPERFGCVGRVPVPDEGEEEQFLNLGILCQQHIFTCAHLCPTFPIYPPDLHLYSVRYAAEPTRETDVTCLVSTSMDVMVLSGQTLYSDTDDTGVTGGFSFAAYYEELYEPLKPARIRFESGAKSAVLKGYHFQPDGKTVRAVEFQVWKDQPFIRFKTDAWQPGAAGGPLITEDMKIIGIVTLFDSSKKWFGMRLDQCLPPYVAEHMSWDDVVL
ncbi:MAG: hypothetical protein K9N49_00570 [Candidatus Marinimicrobia bacterium]|nr:hypothetical protein [Candidatus Neomarinimicrobiota bacterium]